MANLLSIAEQAWRQMFPNPNDETSVKREEVIATAKTEFAFQLWMKLKQDKREYGYCEVPSYLLSEALLPVKEDEIDISGLKIMRAIDQELWFQGISEADCECEYIKTTWNNYKTLCDDDSIGSARLVYPLGKKLKFPLGAHKKELTVVYANNGQGIDENVIEVDDAIAGMVRRSLIEIYASKIGVQDDTNNATPNR